MPNGPIGCLINSFAIGDFSRSSPKFNKNDLVNINANIIKKLSFEDIKGKLDSLGIKRNNVEFWNLIKNNISYVRESYEWWNIINEKKIFYLKKRDFLKECASVLPKEPFTTSSWDEWLTKIKNNSDKKGSELFMPLRLALTGKKYGPKLKYLMPLLSRNLILHRLGVDNGS